MWAKHQRPEKKIRLRNSGIDGLVSTRHWTATKRHPGVWPKVRPVTAMYRGLFTCTSVAIVKPKVRAICMTADESTTLSHIMLPQPINNSMAVPRNSANAILHILLLSDTSSIAIMPWTTGTRKASTKTVRTWELVVRELRRPVVRQPISLVRCILLRI